MNLKEFITKFILLHDNIAVFDNKTNEQYFEGKARELYRSNNDILMRDVANIEPDYNMPGWIIIVIY